jgi:hypothetical protein
LPRSSAPLAPIVLAVTAVALAGAGLWSELGLPLPACLLREAASLPCPACGGTRALHAALGGRFIEAFAWNPLLSIAALVLLGCSLASLGMRAAGRPMSLRLDSGDGRWVAAAALAAVLANGIWQVSHGT